ncbi:MAG TPA: hypothetical protein DCE41_16530 [Cytophagales bacterium]|nr:hypothetical protein [Cytophagales bacterium]HAA17617.1 hypothetical protein [Cytophagales bacterium]HAP63964.1 hypothetical protein [Cytophagales bacterium]
MSRKLDIVIDNTPITAEDAAAYQDFGQVLQGHKAALRLQRWKWAGIGGGTLGMAALAWVAFGPMTSVEPESPIDLENEMAVVWSLEEPVPATPEPLVEEEPIAIKPNSVPNAEGPEEPTTTTEVETPVPEPEEEEIPMSFEEGSFSPAPRVLTEAEPWDGFPALYEFLRKETQYPTEALPDSVQGIVWVAFQIDTLGRPQKVRVAESLHPLLDHEATRVIRNMPDWKPARMGETPVVSRLTIPITFRILTSSSEEK